MNNIFKALMMIFFKVGEWTFKTIWLIWVFACVITAAIAMIPAILMDHIGHYKHPKEKQFGVVGVGYMLFICMVKPLQIIGWDKLVFTFNGEKISIEDCYEEVKEHYKNGL